MITSSYACVHARLPAFRTVLFRCRDERPARRDDTQPCMFRCSSTNIMGDVLRSRPGWQETPTDCSEDYDFNWTNVHWVTCVSFPLLLNARVSVAAGVLPRVSLYAGGYARTLRTYVL